MPSSSRRTQGRPQNAYDGGQLDFAKFTRNEADTKPMSKFDRFKLKFSLKDNSPSQQVCVPPKQQRDSFLILFCQIFKDPFHYGFRDLVLWRISTTYFNFFVQSLIFFLIYINIFALLIYLLITAEYVNHGSQCSSSLWFYEDWKANFRHNMEIAFELSWITFTTVGYGNVAPSTANSGCYGLRYLCAFEAFIGLVYFSLLGAIFFSKIGLTFGEAPITFSRAVCIKYDAGSTEFPVLEMQIVHNKANQVGHEILSASLLCMVAIDVLDSDKLFESEQEKMFSLEFNKGGRNLSDSRIAKQTYHEIKLVGGKHPYFNRVWQCQHILDENSPLLKRSVREEIKITGCWPTNKLSHRIRLALVPFNTMLVTMNGTSALHSRQVYAEKRYSFDDIYIGWEFAGLMYLKYSKSLDQHKAMVDMNLIHDIVPYRPNIAESFEEHLSLRSQGFRERSVKV